MKIHPLGAELFHADGPTDLTNLMAIFRNFVNAPKIVCNFCVSCLVFKGPCFFHHGLAHACTTYQTGYKISSEDKQCR